MATSYDTIAQTARNYLRAHDDLEFLGKSNGCPSALEFVIARPTAPNGLSKVFVDTTTFPEEVRAMVGDIVHSSLVQIREVALEKLLTACDSLAAPETRDD